MNRRPAIAVRRLLVVGALTMAAPSSAQDWGAGSIEDPENAGDWGAGSIEDPENAGDWGAGSIEDPENAGDWGAGSIEDPENAGGDSGAIDDPENRAPGITPRAQPSPRIEPRRAYTGVAPRAIFSGTYGAGLTVDTKRDDPYENTLELTNELEMRVRYSITDRWRAVLGGRLTWDLTSASDLTPFPGRGESGLQGRVRPDLRDFYVSGSAGRLLLRIGNQTVVWGSTDFSRPADQLTPLDLTRGISAERDAMRIPVPAVDAVAVWDHVEWQFVLIPFFVPHRVSVYGADTAPIQPSGLALPSLPGLPGLVLVDPSLEDLAQPLLLQTSLPDETPENISAGSRLTLIKAGWDVSAGYLFSWDRTPRVVLSTPAAAVLGAALGEGDAFFEGDPLERPDVQALLASIEAGESPLSARYDRLHMVEVDGVKYVGPVGVRFEAAFSPRKTTYLSDLRAVRRPTLSTALGLSHESADTELVLSGEIFHTHIWHRPGDASGLYDLDGVLGVAGGAQLGLARFERIESAFAQALTFELFAVYLATGRDLVVSPALSWDARDNLALTVGATVFHSWGDKPSLGDLIDRNDSVFVRLERRF